MGLFSSFNDFLSIPVLNMLEHSSRSAWNVFNKQPEVPSYDYGFSSTVNPSIPRLKPSNERSIINSVINRIALDVASSDIVHARVNEDGKYVEEIRSDLDDCLRLNANIDQTGRALIQDAVLTMCDDGVAAIVPVDTSINPNKAGSFNIKSLRVGKIIQWFPKDVQVRLYDENDGNKKDVIVSKATTAIIQNPLYLIMNEPNSTLRRLIRKLNILDVIDEQSSSGKLDLMIQLPYTIRNDKKREEAQKRIREIEFQLTGKKYGIAYVDGAEKVTQLNRPVENNLMSQIEYLTRMFYNQLGLSEEVFNGTADDKQDLNYQNQTIEPMLDAITKEMTRKFLTKTARTQGQAIIFFRDPFKMVPARELADIADKLTRNEILSSNEVRSIIGYRPSDDPRADQLVNKNINQNGSQNSQLTDNPVENIEVTETKY